jgi:hypothetical protein
MKASTAIPIIAGGVLLGMILSRMLGVETLTARLGLAA